MKVSPTSVCPVSVSLLSHGLASLCSASVCSALVCPVTVCPASICQTSVHTASYTEVPMSETVILPDGVVCHTPDHHHGGNAQMLDVLHGSGSLTRPFHRGLADCCLPTLWYIGGLIALICFGSRGTASIFKMSRRAFLVGNEWLSKSTCLRMIPQCHRSHRTSCFQKSMQP